jgi:hypothetical protein
LHPCTLTFYTDSFALNSFMLAPGKPTRGGFMHRCGSGFLLTSAIIFVLALTGCLGKSSSNNGNGGVTSVTVSPSTSLSLDVGGTQVFSASARDALGRAVIGANIQFLVVSGNPGAPPPLSIASNGNACAGSWDASVAICSPGTSGIALVTAVTEGVSSPTTLVYVHQHIDSIQIVNDQNQQPPYDCFSQGQTWQFKGIAYSNNVDITDTVGPINWSSSNSGVVTPTPIVSGQPPNQQLNQIQTTAKSPGITQLFASVSGTTSNPYPYTTCLIQALYLQIGGQAQAGNSITVNNGGSIPITATAIDTLYNKVDFGPLAAPPLTWSTTNPEVVAFSTTSNSTGTNSASARANLGGGTLTASCSPPTCNIGVLPGLPIYASNGLLPNGTPGYGAISVDVTSASQPPNYTAWAATTGCQNATGCSSATFAVTHGTTPIGPIVSLPRTPNSMMFNHLSAARLYLGSDQGLMYVDVTGNNPAVAVVSPASIPCNVSLCGKVLTISNDGKLVVVADTVSTPSQVYIFNAGSASNAPADLIIPGQTATAAAFSPDQLKLFILTNTGNMYVYSTADGLNSVPIATTATDVKFSADGSFAYVTGTPTGSVSAYSTCSLPAPGPASVNIGNVTASSTPLQIFPSPSVQADSLGLTQTILALEPPNIELLTAQHFTQVPIPYKHPLQLTCDTPTIQAFTKGPSFNLGQGNFTPLYAQLVADGSEMIVVAKKIPAVLTFDVSNGTTTSVSLVGSADPLAASASTDGSQVFVAACDQYDQDGVTCAVGSIHIVNTISQGDIQQVPYVNVNNNNDRNMCSNNGNPAPQCLPNMVAIRPQ